MAEDGGQPPATSGESPTVDRWRRRSLGLTLAAVATVYLTLALVLPAEVFWSPDEGAKLLQALSFRPGGARSSDIPYGGRGLDPELTFYPRLLHPQHPEALRSALYPQPTADGGVRFHWPSLFPLASLAPYRLLGARGLYLMPLVGGLLAAAAAAALGRAVDPAAGAPAALAVGLSSPVLFYSLLFWEHAPAVALGLGGVLTLVVAQRAASVRLAVAAALLAGAVVLRPESLLLPAPFLVLTALLLRPPPAARGRPALLLGSVTALYLVLGTALAMTKMVGGLEWGNRYLLPLEALGAVVAAVGAVAYWRRDGGRRPRLAVLAVTTACLVTGALYQARGVRELLISKGSLEACRREVVNARGPVVTDLYWLPAALAGTFAERPLFTLRERQDLGRWLGRVGVRADGFLLITSAGGTDEVERWLGSAAGGRVRLVGTRPVVGLTLAEVEVTHPDEGGEG